MPIRRYLQDLDAPEPEAIEAMSKALEEVCQTLHTNTGTPVTEKTIATRIINLARSGVIDAKALSERVIREVRTMQEM